MGLLGSFTRSQHAPATGQSASALHFPGPSGAGPYLLGSPRHNAFQRKQRAPAAPGAFSSQCRSGGTGYAYLPQFEKQATVLSPPSGMPALSTTTPLGRPLVASFKRLSWKSSTAQWPRKSSPCVVSG